MKRFNCFSLVWFGYAVASCDILLASGILALCSYYLYNDYLQWSMWPSDDGVQVLSPLNNFIAAAVDYVLLNNFSQAFHMVLAVTLWLKALINLVVASILVDGIRKQRLICIAPWLINTCVSMVIEVAVFVLLELKLDEVDTSMERRIVRSIIFGVFMVINALLIFGIYALTRMLKAEAIDANAPQESIVETSGMFQHVKV